MPDLYVIVEEFCIVDIYAIGTVFKLKSVVKDLFPVF
jgi:hypothetical protein